MKKFSSALALAAAMGLPATGMAAQHMDGPAVDFGAEFELNGYMVDRDDDSEDDDGNDTDEINGIQQRALLNMNIKGEGGVSFHTGILLSGDTWSGDDHTTARPGTRGDAPGVTGASDNGDGGDDVRVDTAYVQVPMLGGVVRAGRMKSQWGNCFTACDDRRDRVQYLTKIGNTTAFGIWDKRQEGQLEYTEDDGDMWLLGFIGNYTGWTAGSLFVYWSGDEDGRDVQAGPDGDIGTGDDNELTPGAYALTDVFLIAPYVKGRIGPVDVEGGMNYFDGGSEDAGAVFQDAGTSEWVRLGWDTGPVLVEGQVTAVQGGGLIADGFDSFSSLIGNNPDHDQNPTRVAGMGDLGIAGVTDELDQQFYALRVSGNVTDQWKLVGAVGGFNYDNSSDNVDFDGSGTFYDIQAHYMVTNTTTIWATWGMLEGDDIQQGMRTAAAEEDEADPSAMSLNLITRF